MTAAMKHPTTMIGKAASFPCEDSSPAVKRRESPGRKKPISRPDSAKMMRKRPMVPKVSSRCSGSRSPRRARTGDRTDRRLLARAGPPALGVEVDDLVLHEHLAVDPGGRAAVGVGPGALPLQV